QDVCAAIKEFFTSGKMLGELNATLISLIRKEFMKGNNWDIGVRNYTFEIDIQKAYDTFLWSNKDGKGSMVSVKWTNVCKPKSQGGLGLKSMHE
nr:hypothetical protein [Tanacetum cinerariifolium]